MQLATRHWDHVVPIALGDLSNSDGFTLERRDRTPDLWQERTLDAGETSFSRYVRARAAGDDSVTALPVFLMRGFRHRCIITRTDSLLETASDLKGKRVGATGWPDSGNTWTRAILRGAGVEIADVDWMVGRLTADHPTGDRIGDVPVPSNVNPVPDEEPMIDAMLRGGLDAIMTPFMPPGFYDADSPMRTLFRNPRGAEAEYFAAAGFIPGIHLLAIQSNLLDLDLHLGQELVDLFESAKLLSQTRRQKLQDVTPWQNEEIAAAMALFGHDWLPYGWQANSSMIDAFQNELVAQGLLQRVVPAERLFPLQVDPSTNITEVAS